MTPQKPQRGWNPNSLSASLAYDMGQTVRSVANGVATVSSALGSLRPRGRTPDSATVVYSSAPGGAEVIQLHATQVIATRDPRSQQALDDLLTTMRATFESMRTHGATPLGGGDLTWQDLEALAEMSGLSRAVRQTVETALEYDFNPVLAKLARNLEQLTPAERSTIAEDFIRGIEQDPFVLATMTPAGGRPPVLQQSDAERLVAVITDHGREGLHELGMTDTDIEILGKIGHDVSEPLVKWANGYIDPRTMSEQFKRYWRLQRIGFKALQIMSRPRRLVLVEASQAT